MSIDESHLFSIPRYNFDPSTSKNLNKLNSTTVSITKDDVLSTEFFGVHDQKNSLIGEDSKKSRKGCFSWLCGCFIKKEEKRLLKN